MLDPPVCNATVLISSDTEWRMIEQIFPHQERRCSPLGAWFTTAAAPGTPQTLFFHGGWGKVAAAASTEYLIQRCRPKLLVNLGTCGGFRGAIEVGTVVLVERTVIYDIVELMGDQADHLAHYTTQIDLSWLAQPYPHSVMRTLMVSGDRDLDPDGVARLHQQFGAVVGDWESASIAWVAARHGLRTLILRGVTDLVGAGGGDAYDGNMHVFEAQSLTMLRKLVAQLPDWLAAAD